MRLLPIELDRLTIFTAAELARRRLAKGWRLTHPEALAIICDEMHEAARGGASYAEVEPIRPHHLHQLPFPILRGHPPPGVRPSQGLGHASRSSRGRRGALAPRRS